MCDPRNTSPDLCVVTMRLSDGGLSDLLYWECQRACTLAHCNCCSQALPCQANVHAAAAHAAYWGKELVGNNNQIICR